MNRRLPPTPFLATGVRAFRHGAAATMLIVLAGAAGCVVHAGGVVTTRPAAVTAEVVTPAVVVRPPVVEVVAEPAVSVSFETTLAPHGAWTTSTVCGKVWRPNPAMVGADFVPYSSGGDWVYTDQGWSFEAEWDWGWAVFHYGRWCPDPRIGWVWVPGTTWAPAWVEWRHGGRLIGWAPLLPPGITIVENHYTFVQIDHFHDAHPERHPGKHVHDYRLPPNRRHAAWADTRPVHDDAVHADARWPRGPDVRAVSRAAGEDVKPVHVAPPRPGMVSPVTARPRPVKAPVVLPPPTATTDTPPTKTVPPPVVKPPVVKPPVLEPPTVKPPVTLPPVVKPPVVKPPPIVKPPVVKPLPPIMPLPPVKKRPVVPPVIRTPNPAGADVEPVPVDPEPVPNPT